MTIKFQVIPSFQAFGPTQQQFQWPLKETLLKSLLQWTKAWKKYKSIQDSINHPQTHTTRQCSQSTNFATKKMTQQQKPH